MSGLNKRLEDAFYVRKAPGKMFCAFWSQDWCSRHPWTYDGTTTKYFDNKKKVEFGLVMSTRFYGPLCFITVTAKGEE